MLIVKSPQSTFGSITNMSLVCKPSNIDINKLLMYDIYFKALSKIVTVHDKKFLGSNKTIWVPSLWSLLVLCASA